VRAPRRPAPPGQPQRRRQRPLRHLPLARQHVPARRRDRGARAGDRAPAGLRHLGSSRAAWCRSAPPTDPGRVSPGPRPR
jgi:hypothetical protein